MMKNVVLFTTGPLPVGTEEHWTASVPGKLAANQCMDVKPLRTSAQAKMEVQVHSSITWVVVVRVDC